MMFHPNKPFNDLPVLPPDIELETSRILKKTITATRSLAKLNGVCQKIPNPSILINSLTLQEAKDSSEIENIFTTNDHLYQAFSTSTGKIDAQTKEVLRYREALLNGYLALKKKPILNTNLWIEIVQTIKINTAGIRNVPGTIIGNPATGKTIYSPPEGEKIIRDLLRNLEDYIHENDSVDPLIKLGIIHYQFEAIHPFFDGNGRTGRILNILYLNQMGLLELPILYLSKYIIERKNDYYQHLRNVTAKNEWEPWVLFILDAIHVTSTNTMEKIQAIRDLLDKTVLFCKEKLPKRVYSKELVELLFEQPYIKIKFLVDANIAQRKTAAEYLRELEKIGVLSPKKIGKENVFINNNLYELLSK
ncbi:MAG: Fic family protein [Candidatus Marinimicrobia bacterium]|nr:Fic family protein [Candidatus Neomarinimicrobiota bacterium]MBT3675388.1 Fic family protein [Candidatus Neomarinimicrobiota bacterium]MBT3763806.1 Fic family protein [Candidatus Neomarinimicrobiota bacterium]MBT4069489.1 Fic family protein [Candidatus Neomarinimicrobiota bacterium]MBT4270928.1 Fic family protein [Candidatus Neomarinimicrobiota bacterium]